MDGRPHPPADLLDNGFLGHSIGHWEGDTLVIDSVGFNEKFWMVRAGLPHTDALHLIERISRPDYNTLKYEATIDDPKTYTKPFTITMPLTAPPGFRILPYECHEGNYMIANSLSAERAEDKALAEDQKKGIVRARKSIQTGNIFAAPPAE